MMLVSLRWAGSCSPRRATTRPFAQVLLSAQAVSLSATRDDILELERNHRSLCVT
jgi:hypothetical protein